MARVGVVDRPPALLRNGIELDDKPIPDARTAADRYHGIGKEKKSGISKSILVAPLTQFRPIEDLRINPKNVHTHSKKQIRQIAHSIEEFGFAVPIVVEE